MLARSIVLAALATSPLSAAAQEIQLTAPLASRVLVLRRLYRQHRLHLAAVPALALSHDGEGMTTTLGGRADFHPTDAIGIGLWGARGRPGWAFAGQITVVPAHGKLSLFGEVIVPIDLYAFGGVGALERDARVRLGPTFGGGLTVYAAEALALTLEARALRRLVTLGLGLVVALPFAATHQCGPI
jgi:hypothetical protein